MTMKRLAYLTGLIGLLGLTALVVHQGIADVAHILAQGGWLLLLLVPLHVLPLVLDAQGWRNLLAPFDPAGRADLGFLLWVAAVREAVNRLLPTANVGGELVGIRLTRLRVPDVTAVTASIVVEVMVTLFTQYLFSALGVLMLLAAMQAGAHGWVILTGLLLSLPVPVLFALSLRHSALFERLEGAAHRLFGEDHRIAAMVDGVRLDAQIRALNQHRKVLLKTLGWQFAGMVTGSLEVWFALMLLGHPVPFWQALAIEALTQAVRHMAFFVPAGLGVQEAVVLLLGHLLGIGPDVSLSLALVKRAREVLFGVPALLSWHWLELRHWQRDGKSRQGSSNPTERAS
ncbi:lysylphosphatidylglycerol synthase domain-containing protein [Crenobacter sp. SG2303]|uniref:Lysylphosphatidylglycerol synthase domain-containing protein n=1 Tax=Crenobacter oryzisoli TaxID=3056844 RepID=A0ABT7XR13_9NEIS|nr:lysylphosphatidylglycerol synthase domain-containing protein [Crenobacter sp. SG2303]MDN0076233.1 lysylphosphatidylglycerol synthase domain-containing protein [Crenobacter sp. SG2303]